MSDSIHQEFFQQNPLSFALYNFYAREDCNLLYINDNPDDLTFKLEMKNLSSEALALSKSTQSELEAPSPNNYHIELKFRPNQLSQRSREKIDLSEKSKEGWSMSRPYENRDRTVSLFLLKRQDDLVIKKQGTEAIILVGLGADSTEGARVTQLEIHYKDFYFAPEKHDEGANTQRSSIDPQTQIIILTVLNYSGKREASLTITFAYAPTLINNGSDSGVLVLQIVNIGQDAITLNENSRFEITIDAQGERPEPWALAKKDEAIQANVFIKNNPSQKYWLIEEPKQDREDPTWVIKPNFSLNGEEQDRVKQFTFKKNEDFFISINNLRTSLLPGIGNLQVAYYNLPGYRDGKITLNVTKTCISERKENGASDGRIGINKLPDPGTHLDVKGKIASDSLEVKGEAIANFLTVNNTVSARKFEGEGAFVTGMIMMWSGAADALPYGWALCDGTKGTPDLRDRFIVGAGNNYPVNDAGSGDGHDHTLSGLSGEFSTNDAGRHDHGIYYEEYNVSAAGWSSESSVRRSSGRSDETSDHRHQVSIEFNNAKVSTYGVIRPPWYALCFIMKIQIRVKDVLETKTENLILERGDKDLAWTTETGYSLVFQKDGNLVLYEVKNSRQEVIWATGTNGQVEKFTASKDGNFALLNSQNKPIWSTKTSGRNRLVLEEDGNLVVYSQSSESSKKLFETGTQGGNKSTTEAANAWKE